MTTLPTNFDYEKMLAATKRLTSIMENETEMLDQLKIRQLSTIKDEKSKLTAVLEKYKQFLVDQPSLLEQLSPGQKNDLKREALMLGKVMNEDRKQIIKAQRAYQMLLDSFKAAVRDKTTQTSLYNKQGTSSFNKKKSSYTPAIALNESF